MASPETRFHSFNHHRTSYKTIGDHSIDANVLIPKGLRPGKSPVIVKFHGGGLVHGEAMYAPWFASWLITFILRNNAIAILPNYRLIPEHTGKDIMEDLADFWKWFHTDLKSFVESKEPGVNLDHGRLMVSGDSAGGLLALQSAIQAPEGKIKALLCQYPMTDYLNRKPEKMFKGMKAPGPEVVDEHLATIKPGTVLSSSVPPELRGGLSYSLSAYGRWLEFYGTDKDLLPFGAVEKATHFPPTLIIHGEQDLAVNIEDTRQFVRKLEQVLGREVAEEMRLVTADGDHGFDMELKEEATPWLKEGLAWVKQKWLA